MRVCFNESVAFRFAVLIEASANENDGSYSLCLRVVAFVRTRITKPICEDLRNLRANNRYSILPISSSLAGSTPLALSSLNPIALSLLASRRPSVSKTKGQWKNAGATSPKAR